MSPLRTLQQRTGREHLLAVLTALFVTFLWSTSWVLIKTGLDDLELAPLSFAGLRYALAALLLLPLGIRALRTAERPLPSRRVQAFVALYGLLFIAVAQGAQFAALAVLPATAVNLILASIPVAVALVAVGRRSEAPTPLQAAGVGLLVLGAALYFDTFKVGAEGGIGVLAALICVAASAAAAHLGRDLARDAIGRLGGPLGLTAASMAIGGLALLAVGVAVEGVPALDVRGWLIVGWLAIVNTAFAFSLWNRTLRTLSAVESSVINNTMVIQVAILAILFLGERLAAAQLAGLLFAAGGALVVQVAGHLRPRPPIEGTASGRG